MLANKLLQAILDGQAALREEVQSGFAKLEKRLSNRIDSLASELKAVEKRLNRRIDPVGKQLNILDDDAPTGDEFKSLEKRVVKLEKQAAIN